MTGHRVTLAAVGAVLGIAVSVGTGVGMIHGYISSQEAAAVQRATEHANRDAEMNARLDEIEKHLKFIDSTLPKRDRQIANEVFAKVERHQREDFGKAVFTHRYSKSMSLAGTPTNSTKEAKPQ